MPGTLFKRLFEVRFLHEYYLGDRELGGALFFSKTPGERHTYLKKVIEKGQYNILNDLIFEPTPETSSLLRGHRLKFAHNATGFLLGGEIVQETAGKYKLKNPLETGLRLSFYVRIKNPLFRSFTALRLRPPDISAFYFFTNAEKQASGVPNVSLAEPALPFETGRTYEPGELALLNGTLQEAVAVTTTPSPAAWTPVAGEGYVTEHDRQALGKQFRWPWAADPQTVQFTLLDETLTGDDARIKTIEVVLSDRNKSAALDFSRKFPAPGQRLGDPIPDGFYTLEAKGTFDTFSKRIYLHGELAAGNPPVPRPGMVSSPPGLLGLVQIVVTEPGEGAPFVDADGYVRREALPDGALSHTIYEVRWLNRSTWWRYRSDRDLSLTAIGDAAALLGQQGKDLVSAKPMRFYAGRIGLSASVNLPNAKPEQLKPEANGRYYSDIPVSKIANLIDAS